MRIFNKMKKMMLVMAASLFCANVAFADTQTVYSWESPDGTPVETGGTITQVDGGDNRLNYSNAGYHSICLNGKAGNINAGDGSNNACHMVLTLDAPLQAGDVINITAYRNKNADGKNATIYFAFENGAAWKDGKSFVNICADEGDDDYDDDGDTPNTNSWEITESEAGSSVIKLTRNSASTNLFIIKLTITREVESEGFDLTAYNEVKAEGDAYYASLDQEEETGTVVGLIEMWEENVAYADEVIADPEATQEDVDDAVGYMAECLAQAQAVMTYMELANVVAEADEVLNTYPAETRVDNAGLADALQAASQISNPYFGGATKEEIQAAIDAINAAVPAYQKENNQLILDAAVKKVSDFIATLDTSDESGTMTQIQAYSDLSYMIAEDVLGSIDVTNYATVMEYTSQIDYMLPMYQQMVEREEDMMAAMAAIEEANEVLAAYPDGVDNAGFAAAVTNANTILAEFNMPLSDYTIEDLNAAVAAMQTAQKAFVMENTVVVEDGTYYLKNVASGKFMNGANSWGTRASLCEHGVDLVAVRQANGKYTFASNWGKGYLGSNGFIDSDKAEWILEKQENGNIAISLDFVNYLGYAEGSTEVNLALTDPTSEAAQWQLLSKDDLLAALADATVENPVDATFFIVGQNFNREDNSRNAAWQGSPALGGDNTNFCAERWNCNFDVYQELTGLPNGYYTLSVQGFYRAGNGGTTATDQNAFLYANDVTTPLVNILSEAGNAAISGGTSDVEGYGLVPNNMASASVAFTAGLYAGNSLTVQVTEGTLRVGVKKETLIGSDWTIFDNFELAYVGEKSPIEQYVDSLNALIAEGAELRATLNMDDQAHASVAGMIDQMTPAAQAVADAAESEAAVKEMISSVYMFLFQTKIQLAQYDAQMAQTFMATYENPTDEAGFEAAITQVFIVSNDLMMGGGAYTMEQLDEAVAAMKAAQEAFIAENAPAKTHWDFAALYEKFGNKATMTFSEETVKVAGTDCNLGTEEYDGLAMQGANKWFTYESGGLYQGNGGGRKIGVLDLTAGQIVTVVANNETCLALADETTATLTSTETVDGKTTFVYTMIADGTLALTMTRYYTLFSIDVATPSAFDLAAFEEAVVAAEAFKAVLAADEIMDEMMIEECIVAVDEAIAYAQEGIDEAATQEDVDVAVASLVETVEFFKKNYETQVAVANAEAVVAEAQEALEKFENAAGSEELTAAIDATNEIIGQISRPLSSYTIEDLNASVDALSAALAAFLGQNAPKVAYLCGATEINDAVYNALVAGGCIVTPLNYDDVLMTAKIVEDEFVGKYDIVVLGGATADDSYLAKTFDEFVGKIHVLSTKNAWYRQALVGGVNGGKPGRADAPSISLTKTVADHPIFAGIEGEEFAVFNDMQKEDGNYLLTNGAFGYDNPKQVTLATINTNECIGEAWMDDFGWIIIPAQADALQEGYLTAEGETLFMNAVKYLVAGEPFAKEEEPIEPEDPYTVAYLCGATETTEDIYTALVDAGYEVTPLNYDDVTLTEEIVANDFVGKYDVVVLAGATGSGANLAKSANLLVGKVHVLSTKSFWYKHYGSNGSNPGTADAPSRSLVKTAAYAEHPIFEGIAGDEIIVFNDMAKETGRYLQGNGSFADGPAQVSLATTNGADCIGEGWMNGFGYMIVPVDGAQPAGYLTEDGKAIFVNIVEYLINGEQYASGIESTTVGATQWPADIYDIHGRMVKKGATSLEGLQKGLYFINGKKYLVK